MTNIKMTVAEYFEKNLDGYLCDGDNLFAENEKEFIEQYKEKYNEKPKYCYGTYKIYMELEGSEIKQVEEDFCGEKYEPKFDGQGVKEYNEFIAQWNSKWRKPVWYCDTEIVVVLEGDE